jgi:hypothetical protein
VAAIMFVEICDAEFSDLINTVGISQLNYNATQQKCHHKHSDGYDNVDHDRDRDDDPITYEATFSCCIYLFCVGVKLSLNLREENRTRASEQNLDLREEVMVGLRNFKIVGIVICTLHDLGLYWVVCTRQGRWNKTRCTSGRNIKCVQKFDQNT